MQRRNNHPERDIQEAIVKLIRIAFPRIYAFSVPNGGYRRVMEAMVLKRMGVQAGVGDLCILWSPGRVGFIEVKSDKGQLTEAQKSFEQLCRELSVPFAVVKSVQEANDALKKWGAG